MGTKRILLATARVIGLARLARRRTASSLRILGYHGAWVTPGPVYGDTVFMDPERFAARMQRLKASGHPILPLGEAVARLAAGDLPPAAVTVTIDDGWASTRTHMLPVLEALAIPATLYATTWYSAHDLPVVNVAVDYLLSVATMPGLNREATIGAIERLPVGDRLEAVRALGRELGVDEAWLDRRQFHNMTPAELRDAAQRGLDVQLHTHRHIDVASRIDELPGEIADNRAFLRGAMGEAPLDHFCYPGGGHHPRAATLLAAAGVRSATLMEEGLNPPGRDHYALRRLLDGRQVDDATFDAYLSGTLHYLSRARNLLA